MRAIKWIGVLSALLLVFACTMKWVTLSSRQVVVSGFDPGITNYGKPGYLHVILAGIFLVLTFIPRVWAKRLNLLMTAINVAWAIKNFFGLGVCSGGECLHRETGIWLVLLTSIVMLVAALFPDMKVPVQKPVNRG